MCHGKNSLTYADAGVDIQAGNELIERIKPMAASTIRPGVTDALGGFGALFDLKAAGFEDPILVSATDGVGTKLRLAIDSGDLSTVGIDLVAMCVNDLICQGATPLFFLDYFATAKLDIANTTQVIKGITSGCRLAQCALIGGETAEMPGMYNNDDFDLAGFAVGAVERANVLPRNVADQDILIGLPASGLHSNGFSLIRKIIADAGLNWDDPCPFNKGSVAQNLLEPTRIYVMPVLAALNSASLNALAHITGGGLSENLPRILPEGFGAVIDLDSWRLPPVFNWMITQSGLASDEALKTLNCGIGMVLVASPDHCEPLLAALGAHNQPALKIGHVEAGHGVRYTGHLS